MQPLHTDSAIDATAQVSVERARELIESSEELRSRREKANRKRFGRLFKDPKAIEVTITLTDGVMRIHLADIRNEHAIVSKAFVNPDKYKFRSKTVKKKGEKNFFYKLKNCSLKYRQMNVILKSKE